MKKELTTLDHIEVKTKNGGKIYVLDKGEIIDSESEAMLQALHSRSTGGFLNHLKLLEDKGSDDFMSKFYVGYGHKSIGDCGSVTVFIEGVSMLAAKAIQDNKLYNGQEASTRYLDFSKQKFISPVSKKGFKDLLESLRQFYLKSLPKIEEHLKKKYPIERGEKKEIWEKAIKAKVFDIARGFLPAGASTNLAWHGNLRQMADRIKVLKAHPLTEVRNIGVALLEAMLLKYPSSFSDKEYPETEKWVAKIHELYYYHDANSNNYYPDVVANIKWPEFEKYRECLNDRPEKAEIPAFLHTLGDIHVNFVLDYGSFRDIQRQRAINQRMPLLTTELGFHRFYLESLPINFQDEARDFLLKYESSLSELLPNNAENADIRQYYIPMGYLISNYFSGTIPAIVYMIELRATRFVHPTLRDVAIDIGTRLKKKLNIPIYMDTEPTRFDIKRGEHDIEVK